jgi:hypothetical protein
MPDLPNPSSFVRLQGMLILLSSILAHLNSNAYAIECKTPDFDSYSTARNLKNSILAEKPNFKTANFGQHFLILKASLSMETLWFIVDCETGKFAKQTLEGSEATFTLNSSTLELRQKEGNQIHEWKNGNWTRVEKKSPDIAASTNEPEAASKDSCSEPDFHTYHRADTSKESLLKQNPIRNHPNFSEHYFVMKSELLFETLWFAFDCRNGKFIPEFLKATDLKSNFASPILTTQNTGEYPRHYKTNGEQWIETLPLSNRTGVRVKNSLIGKSAREFASQLPNPEHHHAIEFKNLLCHFKPNQSARDCSIELEQKVTPIPKDAQTLAGLILTDFGAPVQSQDLQVKTLQIAKGVCIIEKSSCDFEIEGKRD